MKKIVLATALSLIFGAMAVHAAPAVKKPAFSPVSWRSDNPDQVLTINHEEGGALAVFISVAKDDFQNGVNGINIKNCGKVTHLDPGSSTVCYLASEYNSISFGSDGKLPDAAASGTYQIEQKP